MHVNIPSLDMLYDLSYSEGMKPGETYLLGLLAEPASGYDLKQAFDEAIRHFWSADMAQIYRTLQRLEDDGLLRSKAEPSEKGPVRRIYQRTAAGRKQLIAWLKSGPQFTTERLRVRGSARLYARGGTTPDCAVDLLQQLRAKFKGKLDYLRQMERAEKKQGIDTMSGDDFYGFLALRGGIRTLAARVAWCDEAIVSVNERYAK